MANLNQITDPLYLKERPYVTPDNFGAIGNGIADDSAAVQDALDSGFPVLIPAKSYMLGSSVTTGVKAHILGLGEKSLLLTNGDFPAIIIGDIDVQIRNIGMLGTGRGAAGNYASDNPNNHGIMVDGSVTDKSSIILTDIFMAGFGGAGIFSFSNLNTNFRPVFIATNVSVTTSLYGFYLAAGSEYSSFNNCIAGENEMGFRLSGGNNSWNGGQITSNRTGVYVEGGANNAHSVVSGTSINHSIEYSVWTNGVTFGQLFSSCMIYYGDIYLQNSDLIKFVGCDLHTPNFNAEGSDDCEFIDIKWLITPVFDFEFNASPSNILFNNNFFVAGSPPAEIKSTFNERVAGDPAIDPDDLITLFQHEKPILDEVLSSSIKNLFSTAGTLITIGDSISEGYNASSVSNGYVDLLANKVRDILDTPLSAVGITNFADPTRYSLSYGGTTSIVATGPVGNAIELTPGSSISFTGGYDFVDFWFKRDPSAGFIDIYYNAVLYRSIDCSGVADDISTFDMGVPVQTPSLAPGNYEIRCRAATSNVTITALFQLIKTTNPNGAIYFLRDAVSGYTTQLFLPYLTDIAKISSPSNSTDKCVLYMIALGTNNIYGPSVATTAIVFGQQLDTIFSSLLTDKNQIVYIFPPKAGPTAPEIIEPYENYHDAAMGVCLKYGVQMIDLSHYNFYSMGLYNDDVHPTNDGHYVWSEILYSQLLNPEPINRIPFFNEIRNAPLQNIVSANSDFVGLFINNGTTNAHGLYVNIGPSSTGIPFRVDVNSVQKLVVSNSGRILVGGAVDDGSTTFQVEGHIGSKDTTADNQITINPVTGVPLIQALNHAGLVAKDISLQGIGGNVSIGSLSAPTSLIDIFGISGYDQLRLRATYTPTSSADANGSIGEVAWDDNFFYIKTSAGWKRSTLTTF